VVRDERQGIKDQKEKFDAEITTLKELVQELFTKKDELREEYFKAKLDYELEHEEVKHSEWISNQKLRLAEKEENRKKRIEEKIQSLKDRSNPYQKEVDTCDHLIAYCNKLKVVHGLINPAHEDIAQNVTQKPAAPKE